MYRIKISKKAKSELKAIKTFYNATIIFALEEIKEAPLLGKPLTKEFSGTYSIRVGVYRIIYRINKKDRVVTIISAGHRATVYQ